jgi:hypothetical protein
MIGRSRNGLSRAIPDCLRPKSKQSSPFNRPDDRLYRMQCNVPGRFVVQERLRLCLRLLALPNSDSAQQLPR